MQEKNRAVASLHCGIAALHRGVVNGQKVVKAVYFKAVRRKVAKEAKKDFITKTLFKVADRKY